MVVAGGRHLYIPDGSAYNGVLPVADDAQGSGDRKGGGKVKTPVAPAQATRKNKLATFHRADGWAGAGGGSVDWEG